MRLSGSCVLIWSREAPTSTTKWSLGHLACRLSASTLLIALAPSLFAFTRHGRSSGSIARHDGSIAAAVVDRADASRARPACTWRELKGDKLSFDAQVLVAPTKQGHVPVLEWWKRYARQDVRDFALASFLL